MSDIHTVGLDLFSFSDNGMRKPVSRITLYVNNEDDQVYTAGDDTGLELAATCIYATEEMAKTLLSMAKGAQYQMYEAQAANLDPAAELGDGIEVGGITSVIAQINDNGDGYPDVSASGEQEVEDEYPGASRQGPIQRELSRARSLISKTNDRISMEIYGENGKGGLNGKMATFTMSLSKISTRVEDTEDNYSLISQDVNKIAQEVHGTDGKGGLSGQYTALQQTVKDLSFKVVGIDGKETTVKLSDGKIDLSGLVTFSALEGAPGTGTTKINGGWIDADTLNLTGKLVFGDFTTAAKNEISGTASKAASTYIDEWRVESPILKGAKIYGGEFWDTYKCGKLTLAAKPPTTDPDGAEIAFPWLSYEATNYQNETANIFSVAPTVKDFSAVDMMMLGSVILSVSENGKIFPSRNWDFSNAEVTAVFGE